MTPRFRRRLAAAALLSALLPLAACAGRSQRTVGAEESDDAYPQPPDGRWLRDAAGREYFVERVPKSQARRLGPDEVRSIWGFRLDVVGEDETAFHVRILRPRPGAPRSAPPVAAEPEVPPEVARAIAAGYRVSVPRSRTLRLEPFGRGLPATGQWRDGFAVADMNGDGRPDIVHGPARKSLGTPTVFLGDGTGGWARWREARWPPLAYDYGTAAAGDVNGDGAQDIVLGVHLRGILVLAGDGRGGFAEAGRGVAFAPGGAAFSSKALALADADGDGRPDILALGEGPRLPSPGAPAPPPAQGLLLYRNAGDGSWEPRAESAGAGRLFGASIALGDFDGDGVADAATGSGVLGRREIVNLGRAGGEFVPVEAAGVRPASVVRSVAAADFDGDGRADLALAYSSFEGGIWRCGVDVLFSDPGRPASRRVGLLVEEGQEGASAVAAGDLDGDGDADLAVLTDAGEVLLFTGDGKGALAREEAAPPPYGDGCRGTHALLADLDGDGRAELAATFAGEDATFAEAFAGAGAPSASRCPGGGGIGAWKAVPAR